jgi:hypothetical protein
MAAVLAMTVYYNPYNNLQNIQINMKTRIILFLAVSAVATLSFTFVSVNVNKHAQTENAVDKNTSDEPIGGFLAEDNL